MFEYLFISFMASFVVAVSMFGSGVLARRLRNRQRNAPRDRLGRKSPFLRPLRWVLLVAGWGLLLLTMPFSVPERNYGQAAELVLAGGAMLVAASLVHQRERRRDAMRTVVHELSEDYVLYLRPFEVDNAMAATAPGVFESVEESLAAALESFGKVVAVGNPHEALPEPGASRLYLDDAQWRKRVREMITRARLCVVVLGPSDATRWELGECVACLRPEQLLLVVPPSPSAYEDARRSLRGLLRRELPPAPSRPLFVMFEVDWQPRLLCVDQAPLRYRIFGSQGARKNDQLFRIVLGPLFEARGMPLPKPRPVISWPTKAVAAVAVVLLGLAFVLRH